MILARKGRRNAPDANPQRHRQVTWLALLLLVGVSGLGLLTGVANGVEGEAMTVVLLLVDDRVYQPDDPVKVNFYFQKEGQRIDPDDAPVLQINPDTHANNGRESRDISSEWEDSGHYITTFRIQSSDYGDLESVYLHVSVKVKGQQVEDHENLDIDVGARPHVIDLRLSHHEALPGDEIWANLTARDRTSDDGPLEMEELEFRYRLPGAEQQSGLEFEQTTGRARAVLRIPGNLDQAGALTITAEGRVGDDPVFTRYATVWIPLLRIWFHGVNIKSDSMAFEIWTADLQGEPVSGVDLELEYRINDEDGKLLREGDLTAATGIEGSKKFTMDRPKRAHELKLTGSAYHQLANRDLVFDWDVAQVSSAGYRLEPVFDRFHNLSFFPDSQVKVPLRVLRDGSLLRNAKGTVLAFSPADLVYQGRIETDDQGSFSLPLTLPDRPGPVTVAIFDLADGGFALWELVVKDLRVNLTVERFNLAGQTNMSLELPRELSSTDPNFGFPRLKLETTEKGSGLGWYPVADPANEASQPRYLSLAPVTDPDNETSVTLFHMTLPGFLPQDGNVRFAIETLDRERGRTTSNYWVLHPGESTADLPGPPDPIPTKGDDTSWIWYAGSLLAIMVLLSLALVHMVRNRKTEEEKEERESWEQPVQPEPDARAPEPMTPSEPFYGAPAEAPPPLSVVPCPHCGNAMGVVLEPGKQVLVACPHCAGQCRVG